MGIRPPDGPGAPRTHDEPDPVVAAGARSWDLLVGRAFAGVTAAELGGYLAAALMSDLERSGIAQRPGWCQEHARRVEVLDAHTRRFAGELDDEIERCLTESDDAIALGCRPGTDDHDRAMTALAAPRPDDSGREVGRTAGEGQEARAAFLCTWWERDLWEALVELDSGCAATLVAGELQCVREGQLLPRTPEEAVRREGLLEVLLAHHLAVETDTPPPE